jgi:hypothetical protein
VGGKRKRGTSCPLQSPNGAPKQGQFCRWFCCLRFLLLAASSLRYPLFSILFGSKIGEFSKIRYLPWIRFLPYPSSDDATASSQSKHFNPVSFLNTGSGEFYGFLCNQQIPPSIPWETGFTAPGAIVKLFYINNHILYGLSI